MDTLQKPDSLLSDASLMIINVTIYNNNFPLGFITNFKY